MKRILIIDDHQIISTGLEGHLKNLKEDVEVLSAYQQNSALEILNGCKIDLVILDINLKSSDGFRFFRTLNSINPDLPILIYSYCPPFIFANRFLSLGAKAYLHKSCSLDELFFEIFSLLNSHPERKRPKKINNTNLDESEKLIQKLSNCEIEVLRHLASGINIGEISKIMKIHTSSASTYKARILKKIGYHNLLALHYMLHSAYGK